MEVYVDARLVKSKKAETHLRPRGDILNFKEAQSHAKSRLILIWGVIWKILGYMVMERGIEVNPEKVRAVIEMSPSASIKDIQILIGRMSGLSCFISRAVEKGFSFFKILQKGARFPWTEEAHATFNELKKFLANLPLLTKPIPGGPLIFYVSVGAMAVSSVLLREWATKAYLLYHQIIARSRAALRRARKGHLGIGKFSSGVTTILLGI